jgi:integration host factor subunit beta
MTKRGIIEQLVTRRRRFSFRQSEMVVNAVFDALSQSLSRGERIEIRGFGSFGIKQRDARQCRNPKTGEAVVVRAKCFPFFRPGKELRAHVNGPPTGDREPPA